MDPPEEEQVAAGRRLKRERVGVDPVMDRRQVVEARMPVGVADRNVGGALVVALVDRQDPFRREPVDRRQDGRLDEPAVGQRQEVEAVVDEVELAGPLEGVRDVEALGHLRLDVRILGVRASDDGRETARGRRVGGREEGHVDAPGNEPFGQQRRELLPRPVVTGRHAPRDRRQDRDARRSHEGGALGRHGGHQHRAHEPIQDHRGKREDDRRPDRGPQELVDCEMARERVGDLE